MRMIQGPAETPKLRGWVLLSRTLNLGMFNSVKVELATEFFLGESTHEEMLEALNQKITKAVKSLGLVERFG